MLPAAVGRVTVRTMRLALKSHTRTLPRSARSPGTACSVVAGQMKSLVTIRFISGRTEIP